MSQSESRTRAVFRACVVNAVREGEALMAKLLEVTRSALTAQESGTRDIQQRNLASDALRLLHAHEAAMVKAYPMALLEIFAEGPETAKSRPSDPSGMDFGELSLVDDAEVQAQVELSRAQQQALHATDAVLAELNGLVSAAQGLRRVQPERNPLRPENYIRALQRVVAETGVPAPVREAWMLHMRQLLGQQLVAVYQRAAKDLSEHGIVPVGYGVASGSGLGATVRGGQGGAASSFSTAPGAGASLYGGYGQEPGWSAAVPLAEQAQEALLTVGILRQMLGGIGDPYESVLGGGAHSGAVALSPGGARSAWARASDPRRLPEADVSASASVAALQDMAELERLVDRLSYSQQGSLVDRLGQGVPRTAYAVAPTQAPDPQAMAVDVVARMMQNIAQDTRLLPPVQQAVQGLGPAIAQLVRCDAQFFSDEQHPARRLLDELTQRSMAFDSVDAPGFSGFMRLTDQAVAHLSGMEITSAAPFESVLKALEAAWAVQQQKQQAQQEQRAAQARAAARAQRRQQLAQQVAANIRGLSAEVGQVPVEIMDFATGPWADVVAQAQLQDPQGAEGDPHGYLALVPLLFWSVQSGMESADRERLAQALPGMRATLEEGMRSIAYPEAEISAFVSLLQGLHQRALEVSEAPAAPAALPAAAAPNMALNASAELDIVLDDLPAPAASADDGFAVGVWVELVSNRRRVRTQLTWASPQGTLFLFTAPDGSTQSMTRRMRDRLSAEGALRILPAR